MIRTLSGKVTYHTAGGVIVEVLGVGYLVAVPVRAMPVIGQEITLFTHHHVREQEESLYGFSSMIELELFEALLTVPSIGPKSALAILSVATPEDVDRAVESENVAFFASVSGIGKKSAAKIIVELRGKLVDNLEGISTNNELSDALTSLGYSPRDLAPILRSLPSDLTNIQSKLSWILKEFGKN